MAVTGNLFVTTLDRSPQLVIPPPVVAGPPALAKQEAKMWFPRSKVFTHPAFHAGKGPDGRRPWQGKPPELGYGRKKTGISPRARHGDPQLVRMGSVESLEQFQAQSRWEISD